ncbi:MAG: amidohydrolase family protein, partial [Erysipelothrix sp.]|nr:amidohydrolase family protein [Erysipelothrix sp.]
YKNSNSICDKSIDWGTLKNHTILADENDFRFSLHAQGDGAIYKCLEIFNECKKDENGKLINRHSITDLEYSDSYDYKKMGELGVVAEIYPQIMSLYSQQEKLDTIDLKLGVDRRKDYWNRRDMVDNNVIVSCATDLPLLYDNIPNSIYHSVYNLFLDSNTPFNPQNALTITELLKAWTVNGQYNLNRENILGSLEIGKLADITVLSENIFNTNPSNLKNVYVISTIFDGKIVYEKKSL